MAEYKVIYRNDQPDWQTTCPIWVETIQVSRNVETSECYLQLRLRNLSNMKIGRITATATIKSADGTCATKEIQLLDADIEAGSAATPKAIALDQSDIKELSMLIDSVDGKSDWAKAAPIKQPQRLMLSTKAMNERKTLVSESNISSAEFHGQCHEKHNGWWLCSCGAANVGRSSCHQCKAELQNMDNWEDEKWLEEAATKRTYDDAAAKLNRGTTKSILEAKDVFKQLGDYADSPSKTEACDQALAKIEQKQKRARKIAVPVAAIAAVVIVAIVAFTAVTNINAECSKKANDYANYLSGMSYTSSDGSITFGKNGNGSYKLTVSKNEVYEGIYSVYVSATGDATVNLDDKTGSITTTSDAKTKTEKITAITIDGVTYSRTSR